MAKVKAMTHQPPVYTVGEEVFNSATHGMGALFGALGTAYLIVFTSIYCDVWSIVSASIYGGSLIILYTMSTLYHALTNKNAKRVFRIFDHSTIFLLIAGTYTPYALVTLKGTMGWVIFSIVWGSAVIGITLNAISVERFKKISLILYIASGWAAVIAMKPLIFDDKIALNGLLLMLLGGVFYTGGIVFYKLKRIKYFHSIWHLFVLAGSISHYFSILFYVYQ